MRSHEEAELRRLPPEQAPAPGMVRPAEGETNELLRAIVQSVRDYAIFALDATGHIATWNPGAEAIKGWRADEFIGQHFSVFYPRDDVLAGKPDAELRAAAEFGRFEDEGWRVRRDGSRFWANVVITALRDADGTLRGFAKVTRDVTERTVAELALGEERSKLQALNETLERRVAERTAEVERRAEEVRRLAAALAHAERAEQRRLAEVLHDSLQQQLLGIRLGVAAAGQQLHGSAPAAQPPSPRARPGTGGSSSSPCSRPSAS